MAKTLLVGSIPCDTVEQTFRIWGREFGRAAISAHKRNGIDE